MSAAPTVADVGRILAQSARVQEHNARLRTEAAELRKENAQLRAAAAELRSALSSRVVIEQAVGILAEKQHVTIAEAFARLRGHCRDHHRTLHDVAAGIVADQDRRAA